MLVVSLWSFLNPLLDPGQALHRLLESAHPREPLQHSTTFGMSHKVTEGEGEREVGIGQLQEAHRGRIRSNAVEVSSLPLVKGLTVQGVRCIPNTALGASAHYIKPIICSSSLQLPHGCYSNRISLPQGMHCRLTLPNSQPSGAPDVALSPSKNFSLSGSFVSSSSFLRAA